MKYVKLGRTGLEVSPVCIGAMTYGDPTRGGAIPMASRETFAKAAKVG